MKSYYLYACLSLMLLHNGHYTFGTHIRAGEIVVKQSNCQDGSYSITLIMYGNTATQIRPGGGVVGFGDGLSVVTPGGIFVPMFDLTPSVGVYTFNVDHKYIQPGSYTISYSEPNRNAGILNIQNSVDTPFFIETVISFSPKVCNNSSVLLTPPVDKACTGFSFSHNPGAFDEDGDSLSFKIATPLAAKDRLATYLSPNHISFYTDFNKSNEERTSQPKFFIDSVTGTITWDAPGALGEYNIAFVVEEWRIIEGVVVKLGSVRRDMQIEVQECNNRRPDLIIPKDICVYVGTTVSESFFGSDLDKDDVKIEVFSGIFSLANNPALFKPSPPIFQSSVPTASLSFLWVPSCEDVRNQPYQVTVKITDKPPSGPALIRFKTWNIKVIAPSPDFSKAVLDIVQKKAELTWGKYTCANADKIQIWRRVAPYNFNPGECDTGLPKYAGYSKIAEVAPGNLKYIDDNNREGLATGATYCYRLVAHFSIAGGVESKVSIEICLPPILVDAPVITHVSVKQTDKAQGEMIISWRRPYDLNQSEFLKPYEYSLLRSKGFNGELELTEINSVTISDTTFTDKGLNTKEFPYNYRIVLLAKLPNGKSLVPIDTSSTASSVWNGATPKLNSIELNWEAVTPWSNVMQGNPWHLIYRADESTGNESLVLIDSMNVIDNGFSYVDRGTFQGKGLNESEFYCYRIVTWGTYGNPKIISPLENFSQIMCSTILDKDPPCKPSIVNSKVDCDLFNSQTPCSQKTFSNNVRWEYPEVPCEKDTYGYKMYGSNSIDGEFSLIGLIKGNEFEETGLSSLARCYKLTAIDRAGNESEFSETVCYDNCPSVFIPNVITPNGDTFNERFEVYNTDELCSRFIDQINLSVYNRWGQKIITLKNEGQVLWDGNDPSGKPVSSGVYFFYADVLFNTLDTSKKNKQIKGWLHVVH